MFKICRIFLEVTAIRSALQRKTSLSTRCVRRFVSENFDYGTGHKLESSALKRTFYDPNIDIDQIKITPKFQAVPVHFTIKVDQIEMSSYMTILSRCCFCKKKANKNNTFSLLDQSRKFDGRS